MSDLDAARGRATSTWRPLDTVGALLFAALASWTIVAAFVAGRSPGPLAILVLATGCVAFVTRRLTRAFGEFLPLSLVVVLLVAIVATWPQAIHRTSGLLGYSNANGALFALGVGAACLLVLRTRRLTLRILGALSAVALSVLPWLFAADAAAGSAIAVMAAAVILVVRQHPPRWLVPLTAVLAVVALVATIAAGLMYRGDGEGDGGWGLTERRLVLWRDATMMIRDAPVLGVGPGGFAEVSPTAQRDRDASWAHHEPLQIGAETGVPGFLLLLAIFVWALVWLDRGSGQRGAALASVILAISFTHATIDYVWHFPAVPLFLAAILGIGATAGRADRAG